MRWLTLTGLLAAAACRSGDGKQSAAQDSVPAASPVAVVATPAAPPAPDAKRVQGVVFDPASLTRGARVGTVVADMLTLSKGPDSSWTGSARFSGELTLAGRAIPHTDANKREVCFEPDAASAALLPQWSGDTRRVWFCFSNQPEAQDKLAALREVRAATVVIDRYTINKIPGGQENTAELVRVVKRGEVVPQ